MLARLSFEDHAGFQRNTVYWTLAGAAGALAGLLLRGVVPADLQYTVLLGMTGLGIGIASGMMQGRLARIALGAFVGLALGVVAGLVGGIAVLGGFAPLVGAAVGGVGIGLFWGRAGVPRVARAISYAVAAVLGLFVITAILLGDTAFTSLTLPGVQDALSGGLMGLFLSLGGAVGRVKVDPDPLAPLWAEISGELKGDMLELARQGYDLYFEIRGRVDARRKVANGHSVLDEVDRVASETAERLLRLARRWSQIERSVDNTAKPRLVARLGALEEKVAAATDTIIRAEYGAAAESVRRQLISFEKIDVGRERLVARMHRCVAALERISLMLLQMSTTDAEDAALRLVPELEHLDDMSEELSWKTLSVDELMAMDQDSSVEQPSTAVQEEEVQEA
jgi:hypothetical protein